MVPITESDESMTRAGSSEASSPSVGLVTSSMLPRPQGNQRGGSGLRNVSHAYATPFQNVEGDIRMGLSPSEQTDSFVDQNGGSSSFSKLPMVEEKVRIAVFCSAGQLSRQP